MARRRRRFLSHSADMDKNKAHVSSRLPTSEDLSSRNVASPVNVSDERLKPKPQIKDLGSLSAPKPNRRANSLSSCASSAFPARFRALAGSQFDDSMDYKVLKYLLYFKISATEDTKWNPFDKMVLLHVRCMLISVMNIDAKTLESRITELEQKVRDRLSGKKQIMEQKVRDHLSGKKQIMEQKVRDHLSGLIVGKEVPNIWVMRMTMTTNIIALKDLVQRVLIRNCLCGWTKKQLVGNITRGLHVWKTLLLKLRISV